MAPDAPDVVDEILLCRVEVDVLCRRAIEPERIGLGPIEPRAADVAPRPSFVGLSVDATEGRLSVIILLVPPGAGNWFWRSFDEVEMLLWRSSKLGEGRKSYEALDLSSNPPKEKRLWLLRTLELRPAVSLVDPARGRDVGS